MESMEVWIMRNRFLAGILAGACLGLGLVILYAALREVDADEGGYGGGGDDDRGAEPPNPADSGDDITPVAPPVSPLPPHLEIVNAGVGEGASNHA